ncbi:MAG TPA: cupin domain-containing protein [Steroidobacteraceae bacterium]|nr:cupin domain-containing protein [Steroidobacteraceae bacterium]
MEPAAFDFSALIHSSSAAAFFASHWEREPLLLQRGDGAYYDALLTIGDIEQFISQADARYPAIRLARDGAFFAPEAYTRDVRYGDETFRGVPDVEKIFTEVQHRRHRDAAGAAPLLAAAGPAVRRDGGAAGSSGAHQRLPDARTRRPLHAALRHPRSVRAADRRQQALAHLSACAAAAASQPAVLTRALLAAAAPLLELELAAGDLLYLPRGYVHTTTTAERFSAHVTIGVTVYTWVELLSELIQGSIEHPEFRAALPPGFAHRPELRAALRERFNELFGELGRAVDVDALSERFAHRIRAARPRGARFQADAAPIEAHTLLQIAPGRDYRILQERGNTILEVDGRRVRLQTAAAPTLEAICRAQSFTPDTLPATISLDARLALVRYLHGLGFLQLRAQGAR